MVFSNIFKNSTNYFALRILTGLVIYFFYSEALTIGMNSLLHRAHLITKVDMPKWTLISSSIVNALISYGINLVVVILFYIFSGLTPSIPAILGFIFLQLCLILLITGLTFILAPIYVKLRDCSQILELFLFISFYAAPIIYPLSMIPQNIQVLLFLNPLTPIVYFSQSMLIDGVFPDISTLLLIFLIFTGMFIISQLIFKLLSHKTPEYI
jgi:ABC-type polysaccharide/polyol phosphate export permease